MKKSIAIFVLTLTLAGCGPALHLVKAEDVDVSEKTIFVTGSSLFHSSLRKKLSSDNWKVTTQVGTGTTKGKVKDGSVSLEMGMNYSTRYNLNCGYAKFWDFGDKYIFDCTLLDNRKGVDVLNITVNHSEFERYDLDEATSLILKAINNQPLK